MASRPRSAALIAAVVPTEANCPSPATIACMVTGLPATYFTSMSSPFFRNRPSSSPYQSAALLPPWDGLRIVMRSRGGGASAAGAAAPVGAAPAGLPLGDGAVGRPRLQAATTASTSNGQVKGCMAVPPGPAAHGRPWAKGSRSSLDESGPGPSARSLAAQMVGAMGL